MLDKLAEVEKRYIELEGMMSDPQMLGHQREYSKLAKERSELEEIVSSYREWCKVEREIHDNRQLLEESDEAIRELAKEEIVTLRERKEALEERLKILILPKDPNDARNVIVEIRAGTGGDEAALFAAELFRMYSRYAETRRWRVELMSSNPTGLGGYKEIIMSTGPGGQSVNTTDSAVRITHIPTGIVISCQDEKSQHKNRAKGMKILRARLLEKKQEEQLSEIAATRKSMVGSGDRSERIRTYNFPQGRLTDHRINFTLYKLDRVMEGELDEVIDALITHYQSEVLKATGKSEHDGKSADPND